jgi:hypothetical protein
MGGLHDLDLFRANTAVHGKVAPRDSKDYP